MRKIIIPTLLCCTLLNLSIPVVCADEIKDAETILSTETESIMKEATNSIKKSMSINGGQIKEFIKNEDGSVKGILLSIDETNDILINISENTLCVNNENFSKDDLMNLNIGETIYVYRSITETRSLPPQAQGYVIIHNVSKETSLPTFYSIEELNKGAGSGEMVFITDNNGLYVIMIPDVTTIRDYLTNKVLTFEDLNTGMSVLCWNGPIMESYPAQTVSENILIIPYNLDNESDSKQLTRGEFINTVYEYFSDDDNKDDFLIDYDFNFQDITPQHKYADSVMWALSNGYMSGYGNGYFGVDDFITLEQAITVLWRVNNSPMLMDYIGLSSYKDVDKISRYALSAITWAHERNFLDKDSDILNPQNYFTSKDFQKIIDRLNLSK